MSKWSLVTVTTVASLLTTSFAYAQDVPWRVVIADSATITAPGLPAGDRSIRDELLGDLGMGYAGVRMTTPSTTDGYWALKQGTWTQYTQLGVTGPTGPGRSGAEAGHVFSSVDSGGSGAGGDGQRAFVAEAGDPNDANTQTWGVWRCDTTHNIEIARALTDGPLGPNRGAGWVFQNRFDFADSRAMNDGRTLVNAYLTTNTGLSRLFLAKSVPGQPLVPCAMKDSTEADVAPGLVAGDYFNTTWNFDNFATTPTGRVYGSLQTNQAAGIFELCDGPPRALAVTGETGVRGPDIGIATATFNSLQTPNPGDEGSLVYFASYRRSTSEASRTGLFLNNGTANLPLAINDDAGVYGPGWLDSIWSSFSTDSLTTAGEWAAFQGAVQTSDGATPSGLWRVRAGNAPELVALVGLVGAYGPEPNRTWDHFYGNAVLSNGDIIIEARTMPGSDYAVWLLKTDGTKRRILQVGQTVRLQTAAGEVQGSVSSYSIPTVAAPYSRGGDFWIGADGSMLINVNLTTYGSALITATPSNPVNVIFKGGFDG